MVIRGVLHGAFEVLAELLVCHVSHEPLLSLVELLFICDFGAL